MAIQTTHDTITATKIISTAIATHGLAAGTDAASATPSGDRGARNDDGEQVARKASGGDSGGRGGGGGGGDQLNRYITAYSLHEGTDLNSYVSAVFGSQFGGIKARLATHTTSSRVKLRHAFLRFETTRARNEAMRFIESGGASDVLTAMNRDARDFSKRLSAKEFANRRDKALRIARQAIHDSPVLHAMADMLASIGLPNPVHSDGGESVLTSAQLIYHCVSVYLEHQDVMSEYGPDSGFDLCGTGTPTSVASRLSKLPVTSTLVQAVVGRIFGLLTELQDLAVRRALPDTERSTISFVRADAPVSPDGTERRTGDGHAAGTDVDAQHATLRALQTVDDDTLARTLVMTRARPDCNVLALVQTVFEPILVKTLAGTTDAQAVPPRVHIDDFKTFDIHQPVSATSLSVLRIQLPSQAVCDAVLRWLRMSEQALATLARIGMSWGAFLPAREWVRLTTLRTLDSAASQELLTAACADPVITRYGRLVGHDCSMCVQQRRQPCPTVLADHSDAALATCVDTFVELGGNFPVPIDSSDLDGEQDGDRCSEATPDDAHDHQQSSNADVNDAGRHDQAHCPDPPDGPDADLDRDDTDSSRDADTEMLGSMERGSRPDGDLLDHAVVVVVVYRFLFPNGHGHLLYQNARYYY